jgi:hypothetical protein
MPYTADDADRLIAELSASLVPPHRHAFIDAARAALASIPCPDVGIAYRTLRDLQRGFYDPPQDARIAHAGARHHQNKLMAQPPIGRPDRAEDGVLRNRFKRAG